MFKPWLSAAWLLGQLPHLLCCCPHNLCCAQPLTKTAGRQVGAFMGTHCRPVEHAVLPRAATCLLLHCRDCWAQNPRQRPSFNDAVARLQLLMDLPSSLHSLERSIDS